MVKVAGLYVKLLKNFTCTLTKVIFLKVNFRFEYNVMSLSWHLHVHVSLPHCPPQYNLPFKQTFSSLVVLSAFPL